jgi:LmbE family N-acetylglucosaminyl deacetylase
LLPLLLGTTGHSLRTVLCLGAHPDDIEIGCGGTILELISDQRIRVVWVVFSGSARRAREARKGAQLFLPDSVRAEVIIRDFRDGFFPYVGNEIKEFFEDLKGRISPDLVFTHYRHDRHQDHRVISDLTWNTFRNHLILEYEIPKYDGDLGAPNLFAPVRKETALKKLRCLRSAYASQRDRHWFADETFRGLMRLRGMECCAPAGYAEAFYLRKAVISGPREAQRSARPQRSRTPRRRDV